MANPPNNSHLDLTKPQTRFAVYVAADAETQPTEADEQPAYAPISIRYGAGMQLAEARIAVDLRKLGRRIKDVQLTDSINRRVEIWTLKAAVEDDEEGESTLRDKPVFAGEILATDLELSLGESKVLIARVVPYHFGFLVHGQEQYNYRTGGVEKVPLDLEFNPVVDGVAVDNRVPSFVDQNPEEYSIWVDVEGTRSTAAEEFHGDPIWDWELRYIVETLCEMANPLETFIKNPDWTYIDDLLQDAPKVQNVVLGLGYHLCTYLEAVLQRHGYNFQLTLEQNASGQLEQRITFYKIGSGTVKRLWLQEFNEQLNLAKNNIDEQRGLSLSVDISRLANHLLLHGARGERELTIPLYRGWSMSDDGTVPTAAIDSPIGRRWVANEGGDYKGLRAEIGDPPDLFGNNTIPRKRVLEHCLTYFPNTTIRQPPVLEYSTDNGATWTRMEGSGGDEDGLQAAWTLLPNEIGIMFTDETLPTELQATDDAELQLRITGTVRDDKRLKYETEQATDSPNSNLVERLIDVSDQFFHRQRATTGDFASQLSGDYDQRDDTETLEEYGEQLLKQDSAAHLQFACTIPGFSTEYQIGDILTKVQGRNIDFNRHSLTAGLKKYPQVVGLQYDISESEIFTTLMTEYFNV